MPINEEVRLTRKVKAGGCASKLAPGTLSAVLSRLPIQQDENLLLGFGTSDDAGVYRLSPDQILLQTVDFFTPMVDDPFTFGRIAATNAISDIYAMGGQPRTALAVVCFPQDEDIEVLEQILRGGLSVMQESQCVVLGGHSVRDEEIKFGYAVTGTARGGRFLTNAGAQPGDRLLLGKAIGTGVLSTALKQNKAAQAWTDAAIRSMTTSNRKAAEIIVAAGTAVHGMTDVTGFGLLGHAREMAMASEVCLQIHAGAVPLLPGTLDAIRLGCVPGGLISNRDFASCCVSQSPGSTIEEQRLTALYDPQTSGGLLIAVAEPASKVLLAQLQDAGYPAADVGVVAEGKPGIELFS